MRDTDFVNRAIDIAKNYKTLYVMGCFGAPLTEKNKYRYTHNHLYNRQPSRTRMIYAASADTFGFDCVCLIKGILWGWNGDKNAIYGGARYASNGVPDINANGIITSRCCSSVSSDFRTIVPGEIVWLSGHVGIYVGDGLVVECTPAWRNNVQITKLSARSWKKHGKLRYVDYSAAAASKSIDTLAHEVLQGVWGNGKTRKAKLEAAGYNYSEVQSRVNELLGISAKRIDAIAREVILGRWGNGSDRKRRLAAAGYNYKEVQKRVNELLR